VFTIALRHDEHIRRYRVTAAQNSGWELTLTEDMKPIGQVHFDDWHRVERALASLQLEVLELTAHGWHVDSSSTASV
jgi:hypothetical protein